MKLQCSCGAKFTFEVTADMLQSPVHFICPNCGTDASEFVNQLVRQELGAVPDKPEAAEPSPAAVPMPVPASPLRVRVHTPPSAAVAAAPLEAGAGQRCSKHPDQLTVEQCYVCRRPICPKCMELFGYVCSPLCKAKADSHGIEVPVYEGQRSVQEARQWRRVVRVSVAASVVIAAVLGVWFWYAWFGSTPKAQYSFRFAEPSYSGQSLFAGQDQIVFLHGDLLARHDMKLKKEIWSRHLVDRKQVEAAVDKEVKELEALIWKANNEAWEHVPKIPPREKMIKEMERAEAAALELRVQGKNVWVLSPGKVAQFDWETGNPVKEIVLDTRHAELIARGDQLLLVKTEDGKEPVITRINLTTCDSRVEGLDGVVQSASPAGSDAGGALPVGTGSRDRGQELAGLPIGVPGKDAGKPMDPAKVAQQAQRLSYPAKIALPAVLANARSQERTLAELNDQERTPKAPGPRPPRDENISLLPAQDGFVKVGVRLLESRIVARSAMRAPPARSALDGPVNASKTADIANEILNEMQRDRGGEMVQENQSRYEVNLRRPDGTVVWTGEVIGHPTVFPLRTVNVLTANKTLIVFDKNFKKLWQATLNYNVDDYLGALEPGASPYGQGPCVERKGALFLYDEGVLTAFDLANGNVRWRLPSVGIAGLFFDDKDNVYVNTTTASLESLKFSRQIDITRKTFAVVMKIEPRTGKVLWTAEPGGLVNYVSGKFIYTVQSYMPDEPDEDNPYRVDTGFETPPYVRIRRIDPKNGHVMWEHFQQRAPLDVEFDKNSIRLVFKKEVQVLRFLAL